MIKPMSPLLCGQDARRALGSRGAEASPFPFLLFHVAVIKYSQQKQLRVEWVYLASNPMSVDHCRGVGPAGP